MKRSQLLLGARQAIPIGLGYLAVGFSVGVAAQLLGLNWLQGFLMSFTNMASAGEYAGLTVIGQNAGFLTMALMILVANSRYLLMSAALSQRIDPDMPLHRRLIISACVTDEMFGLAIAQPGQVNFFFYLGGILLVMPCWSFGTVLGILLGNLMPSWLSGSILVMLFGMFLAIIIPAAKKDKTVLGCVTCGFLFSAAARWIPLFKGLPDGVITLLLMVSISAAAALLFPRKEEDL